MADFLGNYEGTLQGVKSLSGIYRGRVEYNKDPNKMGRVRVRIPLIYGSSSSSENYIRSDDLPWASPCFMGAGAGYGSFVVPEVGEYVFIAFENGNKRSPVCLGSCYGTGAGSKPYGSLYEEKNGNYGGSGQWKSESGINETPIDAQKENPTHKILYKSPKGASVEIEEEDGKEFICMRDMLGQTVKIESNVVAEENINNASQRKSGDIENSTDPVAKNTGARILIMGAGKQKIEMVSKDGENHLTLGCGDVSFDMVTGEDGKSSIKFNFGEMQIITEGNSFKIIAGSVELHAPEIRLGGNVTIIE